MADSNSNRKSRGCGDWTVKPNAVTLRAKVQGPGSWVGRSLLGQSSTRSPSKLINHMNSMPSHALPPCYCQQLSMIPG